VLAMSLDGAQSNPGRHSGARGARTGIRSQYWIPGPPQAARPGMTEFN
jgi:hypothetical protein